MPFTYSGGDDEFQMLNNDLLKKYNMTWTQISIMLARPSGRDLMRAQGPGLERTQSACMASRLYSSFVDSAAFGEGSHFTGDLARLQAHFPISNIFLELLLLRAPPRGAPEAARPTSSENRQDPGMAGLLTPVIQVCHLGGSGTPSIPTHTCSAAVMKPKQLRNPGHICLGEINAPPPPTRAGARANSHARTQKRRAPPFWGERKQRN